MSCRSCLYIFEIISWSVVEATSNYFIFMWFLETFLVVQWLRLRLPMQRGTGWIPGEGANIPHALWPKNQKINNKKQYCNKFNKEFKNAPH